MLDTRQIHSTSDFLRNHKAHVAQLKKTRTPEVLTVNGRAELVILDTETYESMVEQLNYQREKEIAAARAHMAKSLKNAPPQEPITEEEIERRHAILDESGGRDGAAWPVPMTAGSTGPPYRKREYNKNCGIYVKITIANYGGKNQWQS